MSRKTAEVSRCSNGAVQPGSESPLLPRSPVRMRMHVLQRLDEDLSITTAPLPSVRAP